MVLRSAIHTIKGRGSRSKSKNAPPDVPFELPALLREEKQVGFNIAEYNLPQAIVSMIQRADEEGFNVGSFSSKPPRLEYFELSGEAYKDTDKQMVFTWISFITFVRYQINILPFLSFHTSSLLLEDFI
jgi:hypothetical protein